MAHVFGEGEGFGLGGEGKRTDLCSQDVDVVAHVFGRGLFSVLLLVVVNGRLLVERVLSDVDLHNTKSRTNQRPALNSVWRGKLVLDIKFCL